MKKVCKVLVFLSIFTLFSCQKKQNTENDNVEKVNSPSLQEIQENKVKEILFAKKIKFMRIYKYKDQFDYDYYYLGFI